MAHQDAVSAWLGKALGHAQPMATMFAIGP